MITSITKAVSQIYMLNTLQWNSQQQRRLHNSLIMFYIKISAKIVAVDTCHLIPTRNFNYLIPVQKLNTRLIYFSLILLDFVILFLLWSNPAPVSVYFLKSQFSLYIFLTVSYYSFTFL